MSEKNVSREAFAERLNYLRSQPDGWYHGEGKSFRPEDLDQLKTRLEALIGHNQIPWPWLYPVVDTSVAVEWELNGWDISLVVDLSNQQFVFHALHDAGSEETFTGTLGVEPSTKRLDAFFTEIAVTRG